MKLARHTLFNLLGLGVPLLAALGTIPVLIQSLGPERFGILTLIWAVTSYFGLFDLGLGRALTQQLAVLLDQDRNENVGALCATALSIMILVGSLGAAVMIGLAPWGAHLIKYMTEPDQVSKAVLIMGAVVPFIVLTAGLRGMLEACHAFEELNYIRLPMGIWTFIGPWLIVEIWGPSLVLITCSLGIGRIVGCIAHAWIAWQKLPQLHGKLRPEQVWVKPLLTSGGWLTLSNIVSPLMGYADRFVIAAVVSAAAVAFYATPQEIVTKLWILPGALTAVLFPAFAAQVAKDHAASWSLFDRSVLALYLLVLPIAATLAIFANDLLSIWLGAEFAKESTFVLQIFAIGIFINCLAHVPLTWLQSAGFFKTPAILHCIELPIFLFALWLLTKHFGLTGAALAWLLRMTGDSLALFALVDHKRTEGSVCRNSPSRIPWVLGICSAAVAFAGILIAPLVWRTVWLGLLTIVCLSLLILMRTRLKTAQ